MKAYTAYRSVKFAKCLYLVRVSNSSEVRLWESTWNMRLQCPLLPGCPTAARKQTWKKQRGSSCHSGGGKKKQTTNNSAIVLEQLNQEVLIGKTKGCVFLVGYFLLCCVRDLFLTPQAAMAFHFGDCVMPCSAVCLQEVPLGDEKANFGMLVTFGRCE